MLGFGARWRSLESEPDGTGDWTKLRLGGFGIASCGGRVTPCQRFSGCWGRPPLRSSPPPKHFTTHRNNEGPNQQEHSRRYTRVESAQHIQSSRVNKETTAFCNLLRCWNRLSRAVSNCFQAASASRSPSPLCLSAAPSHLESLCPSWLINPLIPSVCFRPRLLPNTFSDICREGSLCVSAYFLFESLSAPSALGFTCLTPLKHLIAA